MFKLDKYLSNLLDKLKDVFGTRLLYMGLQGSYLRNEADENSDIDIMVIIDDMAVHDLKEYKKAIASVGYLEKACGFICGKKEMANWNPLEICHLLHTTKDLYGKLADFIPSYTAKNVKDYIKLSLGNMFHELCHRYIYSDKDKNIARLPNTYKTVFFILQNMHYISNGTFIATKEELIKHLKDEDKEVMEMAIELKNSSDYDFEYAFELLYTWCQKSLNNI